MKRICGLALAAVLLAGAMEEVKVEKVELAGAYATWKQEGMKELSAVFDMDGEKRKYREPYGYDLECINREYQNGASNVFLVAGKDVAEAVKATRFVLTGGRAVDEVKILGDQQLWAVVYLGLAGSGPPAWKIDEVGMSSARDVAVRVTRGQAKTRDMHSYLAVIPLPKNGAATYTVSLVDHRAGTTNLSRTVTVTKQAAPPTDLPPAVNKMNVPAPVLTPEQQREMEELKRRLEKERETPGH